MDKLAAMRAFVEIVDRGSLTAAARTLAKSQPTMVRTLANLEAELGCRLLRRTTRRLALTEEGRGYVRRCRRILTDIDEAEHSLVSGVGEPRGELRITAPTTFGQMHLAPLVTRFLQRFALVTVDLLLVDRVVNLLEEGIDLAVRIGPLPDSSLIATRVGSMRRVVVASPGLLARVGLPTHPHVLAEHGCVQFLGLEPAGSWRFQQPQGEFKVTVSGALRTNQALSAVEACVGGIGFGRFFAYQVEPWLSSGTLRIVLADFEPELAPVNLVFVEARLMSMRLRVLLEFLSERLRHQLAESTATLQQS